MFHAIIFHAIIFHLILCYCAIIMYCAPFNAIMSYTTFDYRKLFVSRSQSNIRSIICFGFDSHGDEGRKEGGGIERSIIPNSTDFHTEVLFYHYHAILFL